MARIGPKCGAGGMLEVSIHAGSNGVSCFVVPSCSPLESALDCMVSHGSGTNNIRCPSLPQNARNWDDGTHAPLMAAYRAQSWWRSHMSPMMTVARPKQRGSRPLTDSIGRAALLGCLAEFAQFEIARCGAILNCAVLHRDIGHPVAKDHAHGIAAAVIADIDTDRLGHDGCVADIFLPSGNGRQQL